MDWSLAAQNLRYYKGHVALAGTCKSCWLKTPVASSSKVGETVVFDINGRGVVAIVFEKLRSRLTCPVAQHLNTVGAQKMML